MSPSAVHAFLAAVSAAPNWVLASTNTAPDMKAHIMLACSLLCEPAMHISSLPAGPARQATAFGRRPAQRQPNESRGMADSRGEEVVDVNDDFWPLDVLLARSCGLTGACRGGIEPSVRSSSDK